MNFYRSLFVMALLLAQCALFSCRSKQAAENVIKINDAQVQTLYMSEYFESIEYIPLETNDECLIGDKPSLYMTDEFIVTIASKKCLVFDRQTGKFIRRIGVEGRGANEYSRIPHGIIVNEQEKTISMGQGNRLIEYSLVDGAVISSSTQIPPLVASKIAYITKDSWAMSFLNLTGNIPNQMLFFDRERVVDSIPNRCLFVPKTRHIDINMSEILFYRYNNNVYYKYFLNDTIFKIVDRALQPAWVFEMRRSSHVLQQFRDDPPALSKESEDYHLVNSLLETDEYMFLRTVYQNKNHAFIFDKKQRQVKGLENRGFVNDIDGGLTFWPAFTNQNQDLIQLHDAYSFKKNINEKGLSEQNVQNVAELQKLQKLVAQLDDEDNPVVVIAFITKPSLTPQNDPTQYQGRGNAL